MEQFTERQLGIHEEMFWHLDVAMPLNLTIAPKISGPLQLENLRLALDSVQKRHPLLRANIIARKGIPYFRCSTQSISLEQIDGDEDTVNRIVDDYTNNTIASDQDILVKASLVKFKEELHYLVLGFHHSITDGRSMVLIVRDIMLALNQIDNESNADLPLLPLEPSYESALPSASKGFKGYLKWNYVFARLVSGILEAGLFIKGMPTQTQVPLKQRRMRTFHQYIEADDSKRIIENCKKYEVTVHTAMHTALALSAATEIDAGKNIPMFLGTIADVRNDMQPRVSDSTGLFAAVMGAAHKVNSNEEFWSLAARVQQQLKQDRALNVSHVLTQYQFKPVNWLLRKLGEKNRNRLLGMIESMQPTSIPLSNLGRLQVLESIEGARKVLEIRGSVAVSILGNMSGGAATMHDRIYTFVGACEPLVSSEQVQSYQTRANEILLKACQ